MFFVTVGVYCSINIEVGNSGVLQLAQYNDSWTEAWKYIVSTGERRTFGGNDVSLWQLYLIYANGPAIFGIPFQTFFGITLIATAAGVLKQLHKELIILTWVAMLGPFSWFMIFKDHSIHHTHMDYIVWYMPFMLYAPVLWGRIGHSLLSRSL